MNDNAIIACAVCGKEVEHGQATAFTIYNPQNFEESWHFHFCGGDCAARWIEEELWKEPQP